MSLTEELSRLLELYRELSSLARVMAGLARQDQIQALEDAWAKRRVLFKRLEKQWSRLEPWSGDWQAALDALAPEEAHRCRRLMAELESSGSRILEADRQTAEHGRRWREQLREDLTRISAGRRLLRAYGTSGRMVAPRHSLAKSG